MVDREAQGLRVRLDIGEGMGAMAEFCTFRSIYSRQRKSTSMHLPARADWEGQEDWVDLADPVAMGAMAVFIADKAGIIAP